MHVDSLIRFTLSSRFAVSDATWHENRKSDSDFCNFLTAGVFVSFYYLQHLSLFLLQVFRIIKTSIDLLVFLNVHFINNNNLVNLI